MRLSASQYAQALYDALNESDSKSHDLIMDRFVKILAQNGDLNLQQKIEEEYLRIERKSRGIKEAEVTVARDIEINSSLIHNLNEIMGNKVEIKKRVDEGIVGGIVVRVEDTLIDASIKMQLNKLNQNLKS